MFTILLYVSELASCIGRHRYQSVESATEKVWQRVDIDSMKLSFARANESAFSSSVRREDATRTVLHHLDEAVNSSAAELPAAVERVFQQPLIVSTGDLLEKARNCASDSAELVKLCTPVVNMAPEAHVKIAAAVDAVQTAPPTQDLDALLTSALETATVGDAVTLEELTSAVYKQRGVQGETTTKHMYERKTNCKVTDSNNKFYKRRIGSGVMLGGRIDGVHTDDYGNKKLVEIKCRQKRLFDYIPEYEQVQIQAYMFVTGIHTCDLVQQYNGDTQVDTYHFDESEWQGIQDAAVCFANSVRTLVTDEDTQDSFWASK